MYLLKKNWILIQYVQNLHALRQHLTQGYSLNRQRLEANAQELEAALLLVRKLAQNPELPQNAGLGLLDVAPRRISANAKGNHDPIGDQHACE